MTSSIQSYPPRLCPPETHNVMAHDLSQVAFVKTEAQGEGNYASTVFSNTRDQETVQGLTLPPKIQSSDPWLFDAAGAFGDQDFDALLGPVQFDLIAEEARRSNLDIDVLFNDEYRLPEPPAKKRKLTGELSKELLPPSDPNEPACEQGPCSVSTANSNQTLKSLTPVVYNPPYSHTTSVNNSPHAHAASVYKSPYSYTASGEAGNRSASLHSVRPSGQANGLTGAAEIPRLPANVSDGKLLVMNLRDEASEAQISNSFDDDGSLFGDYVSSKEGSIECSPIAEPSLVEDVELCAPKPSPAPAVLWDPDVPIPSLERDSTPSGHYHSFWIPQVSKSAPKPKTGPELFTLDQKGVQTFPNRSLQNLVGVAQIGTSVPERSQSQTHKSSTLPYCRPSLPLCVALALATPDNLQSVEETIKTARSQAVALQSTSSQSSFTLTSAHQIPAELKLLLDGLELKFNKDKAFRTSTITWLVEKMASSSARNGGRVKDSENPYLPDINTLKTREDAIQALALERAKHEYQENLQNDIINNLQCDLQQAHDEINSLQDRLQQSCNDATFWKNEYTRVAPQLDPAVKKQNGLQQGNARLALSARLLQSELDSYRSSSISAPSSLIRGGRAYMHSASPAVPGNAPARSQDRASSTQSSTRSGSIDTTYYICTRMDEGQVCGGYNDSKFKKNSTIVDRVKCSQCLKVNTFQRQQVTKDEYLKAMRDCKKRKLSDFEDSGDAHAQQSSQASSNNYHQDSHVGIDFNSTSNVAQVSSQSAPLTTFSHGPPQGLIPNPSHQRPTLGRPPSRHSLSVLPGFGTLPAFPEDGSFSFINESAEAYQPRDRGQLENR